MSHVPVERQFCEMQGTASRIFHSKNRNDIDDAYNASYESMKASWEVLESFETESCSIGDMLELGEYSDEYHYKVGKLCVERWDIVLLAENIPEILAKLL